MVQEPAMAAEDTNEEGPVARSRHAHHMGALPAITPSTRCGYFILNHAASIPPDGPTPQLVRIPHF